MNPKLFFVMLAGLFVAADDDNSVPKELQKSLRKLNDAFMSRDADVLTKLMTDDHLSITPYAGKQRRERQIKSLPNFNIKSYSTEGMKSHKVANDVVLLSYTVKYDGTYKGKALPARCIASSVRVQRDGRWLEYLYQETPLAQE